MKNEDYTKLTLFSRRSVILTFIKLLFFGTLLGRLFYLQFVKYFNYRVLSENNRIKVTVILPLRGKIIDRQNNILADNKQAYRLVFDKGVSPQHNSTTITNIAVIMRLSHKEKAIIVDRVSQSKTKQIILFDNLSWLQLSKIESMLPDLSGTAIELGYFRHYPYGDDCSHVVGYVSNPVAIKHKNRDPRIKIGIRGIEKFSNMILTGQPGINKAEVNARGNKIQDIATEKSINGKMVKLNIDVALQQYAAELYGNMAGTIILIDVRNGQILTMFSNPTYDPNKFINGFSNDEWNKIINDPQLPLINKSISMIYAPGSTFKPTFALTALIHGASPYKKYNCTGSFKLGNRIFHCWKKTGHGNINMYEALMQSCNCYMYNLAAEMNINHLTDVAHKLGFGRKTGIDLPQEIAGFIPNAYWIQNLGRKKWQKGDTANCSLGQGYISASPIQLLTMAASLATGKKVQPRIIYNKVNNKMQFSHLDIGQKYLDVVREGMFMAMNDYRGTAFHHRVYDKNMVIAGKTGTAQIISKRSKNDDLSDEKVVRKFRNHGLFIGFGPVENPKFACCALVEHAGSPRKAIQCASKLMIKANNIII